MQLDELRLCGSMLTRRSRMKGKLGLLMALIALATALSSEPRVCGRWSANFDR